MYKVTQAQIKKLDESLVSGGTFPTIVTESSFGHGGKSIYVRWYTKTRDGLQEHKEHLLLVQSGKADKLTEAKQAFENWFKENRK